MAIVKQCSRKDLSDRFSDLPKGEGYKYYYSEGYDFGVAVLDGQAEFFNIPEILSEQEEYELLSLISARFDESPTFTSDDVEQFYEDSIKSKNTKKVVSTTLVTISILIIMAMLGATVFYTLGGLK